ncbi:MAG: DUF1573 domain-containing protein [Bacteroidales bacterium]
MKQRIVFLTMMLLASFTVIGQNRAETPSGPSIQFEQEVYDYGTIKQYSDATCQFEFKNAGKQPLVITKVVTSCGCTVPDYPKSPIMPGETSQLQVTYDSSKLGKINNQIVVRTNAEEGTVILKIKGKVTQ